MSTTSVDPREIRSPLIASWVLLVATCVLAIIPFLGFLAWIVGGITVTIAIILAIVVIAKGGTWSGILVLLAAMAVVPCVILFGPIVSSGIAAAILGHEKEPGIEMKSEVEGEAEAGEKADEATRAAGDSPDAADALEAVPESAETVPENGKPATDKVSAAEPDDAGSDDQSPP